jgi:predicted negative regulator of RcsB-dependent stress response
LAQQRHDAGTTLEQLETLGDRLVQWIEDHPVPVLSVAAVVLLLAAAIGGWKAWSNARANEASAALAELRAQYVEAMGGQATDLIAPEPANPETGKKVRTEYVDRFVKFAHDHGATTAGAMAGLEASRLYEQLGNRDEALQVLKDSAGKLSSSSSVRGVLESRIGGLEEETGDFKAAAEAYEAAGGIDGYPLRHESLGEAARCWLEAGEPDRALALYERLRAEAPDFHLSPWLDARLQELQARAGVPPKQAQASAPTEAAPGAGAPPPTASQPKAAAGSPKPEAPPAKAPSGS